LRATYLALVAVGLADRAATTSLVRSVRAWPGQFWAGLSTRWHRIFAGLVFFFFARQELALLFWRGSPAGDELYVPWPASQLFLSGGMSDVIHHHSYMIDLPWLMTFPSRLLGSTSTEWLYAYPFMSMLLFTLFMVELAPTAKAFLASSTVLFFVFLSSRDLHDQFGARLLTEALAGLATAALMAEIYLSWTGPKRPASATLRRIIGWGLFISFCSLTRPGISQLSLTAALGAAAWLALKEKPQAARAWKPLLCLALSFMNFGLWKWALAHSGRLPEYSDLTLWGYISAGADLSIPAAMIRGLLSPGSPQAAYTWGLLVVVAVVLLQGKRPRLLAVMLTTVALYWTFTFVLYATLWRHMEKGSAGRYLSHAAVAAVLILPLAFRKSPGAERQI
jgi:hypothetical protein